MISHWLKASLLVPLILVIALAQGPPIENGPFRQPDLLELTKLDASIKLDIRYATRNNFLGKAVYKQSRAFLQRPAAEALARVNQALRKQGYGLVVFDGYRPWSVTKVFWDVTPADKKIFVADPSKGSRHNRGCAVDLSLVDLKTGAEVKMPSEYDEMTERAHINYECATPEAKRLRELLREAMAGGRVCCLRTGVVALRLQRLEGVSNHEPQVLRDKVVSSTNLRRLLRSH